MLKQFTTFEKWMLGFVSIVALVATAASFLKDTSFYERIVVEDGPVEWITCIALAACAGLALVRFTQGITTGRKPLYLAGLLLTAMVFTFGAGEEISWGQRIFGIETPEYFMKNNNQRETTIHNLVLGGVRVNRLVFGKILAVGLVVFLFLLPWCWQKFPKFRALAANFAVPVPKLSHGLIYLVLALIITCIPAPTRGELHEFCGACIFFLMVLYPINSEVFRTRGGKAVKAEVSPALSG